MFTAEELFFNYRGFSLLCKLNLLPFKFNAYRDELKFQTSGVRLFLWKLQMFLCILLYGAFKVVRLTQAVVTGEALLHLNSFIFHLVATGAMLLNAAQDIEAYYIKGEEFGKLFTAMHAKGHPHSLRSPVSDFVLGLKTHSLKELIIMNVAFIGGQTVLIGIFLHLLDTGSPYLLHTSLPPTKLYFAAAMLCEAYGLTQVHLPLCISYFQVMSFFPHLKEQHLDGIHERLVRNGNWLRIKEVSQILQQLVKAQIEINWFNHVFETYNYICKLVTMYVAILGLYIGIHFFQENPIFAVAIAVIGSQTIIVFAVLYSNMYMVPETFQRIKQRTMILVEDSAAGGANSRRYKSISKRLGAIPLCQIRAGQFYSLDRMTCVDYTDFIIRTVTSLLLATIKA